MAGEYLKSSVHVHSKLCDGKNTPEEIAVTAWRTGLQTLGFSGHSHTPHDLEYCMTQSRTALYKAQVAKLKERYAGKLDILCGLEWDLYSDDDPTQYDYWIGSAHYVKGPKTGKYYEIDWREEDLRACIDDDFDGDALAVGYCYQAFGIITNKALLEKAGYSVDDIKSFDDLKKVAEDITARKDELGFSAFSSAGMDGSSDWRYKTHLANLPIYFEYQEDGIDNTDAIKGTYLDNYKNIFDLYINNSTCDPTELAGKTGDDSRNEFLNEEAVFYQNGSWEYTNLVGDGKPFTDDDLTMLPIYIGVGDEANQGLCTGTENYWCVNKEASEDDINATLDFMYWCVSSDEGTKAMANDMGFVIPFKNAVESPNVFVKADKEMTAAGKTPVAWNFSTMPSENWKNGVGSALTAYAAGTGSWDDVVTAFVDGWASEAALNAAA